eukprot:scaffold104578_cov67-Attheya_sp.AAC.8
MGHHNGQVPMQGSVHVLTALWKVLFQLCLNAYPVRLFECFAISKLGYLSMQIGKVVLHQPLHLTPLFFRA